jgi:leucyl-tRNA synthetase
MFIGAFELAASWSEDGVKGCRRFLDRVWKLQDILVDGDGYSSEMEVKLHQTIKKVTNDFETLKYNTAIAALMSLINDFYKVGRVTKGEFKTFLTLLNPVAPHITEELWSLAGFEGRVYNTQWPEYDEAKTVESTIKLVVQINGKTRAVVDAPADIDKDSAIAMAKAAVEAKLTGTIVKEIYVPGKLVNIVQK